MSKPHGWRARIAHWLDGKSDEPRTPVQVELLELQRRLASLDKKLAWSNQKLRERSELLYDLQKQHSSEHFELSIAARDLKIERLRNAGAFAARDVVVLRAEDLQKRIGELKERLRRYEAVEDHFFDEDPILIAGADGVPVRHGEPGG